MIIILIPNKMSYKGTSQMTSSRNVNHQITNYCNRKAAEMVWFLSSYGVSVSFILISSTLQVNSIILGSQ